MSYYCDYETEAIQRGEAVRNHILVMKEISGETGVKVELYENVGRSYSYDVSYSSSTNDEMILFVCGETGYFSFYKNEVLIFKVKMHMID
jgi:hypothetical protein